FMCVPPFIQEFYLSNFSPVFFATRTFLPSSTLYPTRVGSPDLGSSNITLETWIAASWLTIPPCGLAWFGFVCFLMILIPSTITRSFLGKAVRTTPVLPLSLPEITLTLSPFLTCILSHLLGMGH